MLQKATVFLGGLFFVITLTLALLLANQQRELSARDAAPFLGDEVAGQETAGPEEGSDSPVEADPQLPPPVEEAPAGQEPATGAEVEPAPDSEAPTTGESVPVVDEPTVENEPVEAAAPATEAGSVEPAEPATTATEEQG